MDEAGSVSQTKCGLKMPRHFHSEDASEGAGRSVGATASQGIRKLARQRESEIEGGHRMPDHGHMMISIPPKCSVSRVVGYIKGKSAIHIARIYGERRRNFVDRHFWARGYFVSRVGRGEGVMRQYIGRQEADDSRPEQMQLWR